MASPGASPTCLPCRGRPHRSTRSRLSFDELWARLQAGHCAVLDGNPIKVTDPRSPLRSMQAKDDYDHAVFVHAAKGERAFVMDPLGRGRYQGQWVSKVDLRQFASRFTTASGSPYCAVVRRGQQSSVERLRREMREQARNLRMPSSPPPGTRPRPPGHRRCEMPPGPSPRCPDEGRLSRGSLPALHHPEGAGAHRELPRGRAAGHRCAVPRA